MKPLRRITALLLMLCLALGCFTPGIAAADASSHPFSDLVGDPIESIVIPLWQSGIVSGAEPGTFNPRGTVTRAQMATFIVRAMGKSAEADQLKDLSSGFADISPTHWARGFITLASRMGIVTGANGRFNPEDKLNYPQAATMLIRALGYGNQVTGTYPEGYVMKANQIGLLENVHFSLLDDVSRAEAAQMLYNAVYHVPSSATDLTWSQSIYKQAASLTFEALPTYVAPGQQVTLKASAKDRVDNPIPSAEIKYQVVSGSATLSGNTLVVGTGGVIQVRASLGDLVANGTTTATSGLTITPTTFKGNKGGTVQFSASAQAGSQSVPVTPTWTVTGPGTIDTNGLLTVTDFGSVTVKATLGSLSATASGQAVGRVAISDRPDILVPGRPVTLSATATDTAGQPIAVPITWAAVGALIDNTGRITNPSATQVTVTATAGGISDQVTIPVMKAIQVTPGNATILTGRQVTFSALGVDYTGQTHPVDAQWSRSNPNVGVLGSDGTFAGTTSGSTDVIATYGTLQGRAQLQVSGLPALISATATTQVLPAGTGQSSVITVRLLDSTNSLSAMDDQPINLTLADASGATLNKSLILTKKGVGTAVLTAGTTSGTTTVQISAPGTSMTSTLLNFTTYQPTPSRIRLTSTPTPLSTGGGVATITATLSDVNGFPVNTTQPIAITLSNVTSVQGGLTSTGLLIPAESSSGFTTFISGSQPGTVVISGTAAGSSYPVESLALAVNQAGPATAVKIRPVTAATPINGLSSLQVLVDVIDGSGTVRAVDNTSQVQLTITGPTENATPTVLNATATAGTAAFQIPAIAVGTVNLSAELVGSPLIGKDTATAEFVAGINASLRLSAAQTSLNADGFSQTQLVAVVVDKNGTVIPNVNPIITFRKLADGGATSATGSLSVQARDGRAILALQTTRSAGTDSWYASAQGLGTQNLASITTTATSGVAYGLRIAGTTSFAVNSPGPLIVQVVDSLGRIVTTDSGRTITATHTIAGVTVNSLATTLNGVATFTLASFQATTGAISFTTTGLPSPTVSATVSFGTAGNAYSLFISTNPATARVGQAITVSVRVMDNQGMVLSSDNGRTVTAALSGPGSLSSTQATTVAGVATFTVMGAGAGSVTVTFTATGLAQPQQTVSLTFTP